jgi:hypothetical protein
MDPGLRCPALLFALLIIERVLHFTLLNVAY